MKNIDKLNLMIAEYQNMRALAAEAKAEQDRIGGLIKAMMDAHDLEEYVSPTGKAIYRDQVSHPIDTKALKAERPEVAKAYTLERITRPLKIA